MSTLQLECTQREAHNLALCPTESQRELFLKFHNADFPALASFPASPLSVSLAIMTIDSDESFLLDEASSGPGGAVGLPPPMVCIPGGSSLQESSWGTRGASPFEMALTPTTSVAEKRTGEEKVGRWTEEEHEMFLEGLKLHGKQWKTIATMIGTRTVVQVRTHAQKYFQKMERKKRDAIGGSSTTFSSQGKKAGKRKSLPSTMPSRKKPKSPKKTSLTRGVSLSQNALDAPTAL